MRMLAIAFLSLLLLGCGHSPVNYGYQSAYMPPSVIDTRDHIERSIVNGCRDKHWMPTKLEEGKIKAALTVRGRHQIVVHIDYDESGYSITPVSTNMDNMFGRVHSKYNQWVSNLHRQINKHISRG